MPTLIALRPLRHAGRHVDKGTRFDAADRDARVLVAVHLAMPAPVESPVPAKRTYNRRDMTAERPAAPVAESEVATAEDLSAYILPRPTLPDA
jgi:hypothetical protein